MGVRGCGVLKEKKRGNFRLGAGRLWCTVIKVGVWQCVKTGSAGIETNLCFQPADPSVEKVSYEREHTAWSWFWGKKKGYTWY